MKYIVAQYKANGIVPDEFLAYDECLCKSVGRRLFRIFELQAEIRTVAEQSFESRQIGRR